MKNLHLGYLSEFVTYLSANIDVDCIICHGERITAIYSEGAFLHNRHQSIMYAFDLLIVVSDDQHCSDEDIQRIIDGSIYKDFVTVIMTLVKKSTLLEYLRDGNFFFCNIIFCGYEVFCKIKDQFIVDPLRMEQVCIKWRAALLDVRPKAFEMAHTFLRWSTNRIEENDTSANILLMLFYAVQASCIAIVQWVLGWQYDMRIHNIRKLIGLLSTVSSEPARIFPQNTHEERALFHLLMEGRQTSEEGGKWLTIDARSLHILLDRSTEFISICEKVFDDFIDTTGRLQSKNIQPNK